MTHTHKFSTQRCYTVLWFVLILLGLFCLLGVVVYVMEPYRGIRSGNLAQGSDTVEQMYTGVFVQGMISIVLLVLAWYFSPSRFERFLNREKQVVNSVSVELDE